MDDKLNSVLGNPQLMAQIAAAVRGASGDGASSSAPSPAPAPTSVPAVGYGGEGGTDKALNLLGALAPFLKTSRREKLDTITRALAVASVYKNTRNI